MSPLVTITYDGVSLTDAANGILLQPPADMGTPGIRGTDVLVPFRHGAVSVPKFYDVRKVVLNGFVWGADRAELWQRMDALKKLCSVASRGPRKLAFGWPDGTQRYLKAEVGNTLGLTGEHTTFSPVSIEFVCADPFYRDDAAAQEPPLRLNDPRHLKINDPHFYIADFDSSFDEPLVDRATVLQMPNPGVVPIEDALIRVTFHQAAGDVEIDCDASGSHLRIDYPFAVGDTVTIDCRTWRVLLNEHTPIDAALSTAPGQRAPFILPPDPPLGVNTVWAYVDTVAAADPTKDRARISVKYAAMYL